MDAAEMKEISEMFKHHIGILAEPLQHKLDLVIQSNQMLSDKIDRIDSRVERLVGKVDRLETKVDAVAADLSAHCADAEAHDVAYRVKESGE